MPEGTEGPIHRPQEPEDQPEDDRGKQPGPTRNHRLVIDETWHLGFWSPTCAGKAADQRMAALAGSTWPLGRCLDQEKGFQGCFLPGITLFHSKKTPPGGERTPPENATNRRRASVRIRLEPAIDGVKRERMVQDTIRLWQEGLRDTMMDTCGGLHNFRLQYRPGH